MDKQKTMFQRFEERESMNKNIKSLVLSQCNDEQNKMYKFEGAITMQLKVQVLSTSQISTNENWTVLFKTFQDTV